MNSGREGNEKQSPVFTGSNLVMQVVKAPKFEVLKLIEQKEIIGPIDLVDHFELSYHGARNCLARLKKAGLIEPLGIERGKWTLSNKGINHLEFLRRRGNAK